jgi:hypothetical protein
MIHLLEHERGSESDAVIFNDDERSLLQMDVTGDRVLHHVSVLNRSSIECGLAPIQAFPDFCHRTFVPLSW